MAGARKILIRCGNRFKYPPMDRRRYLREQARSHIGMHFNSGSEPAREEARQAIEITELSVTNTETQQIQHAIQTQRRDRLLRR